MNSLTVYGGQQYQELFVSVPKLGNLFLSSRAFLIFLVTLIETRDVEYCFLNTKL